LPPKLEARELRQKPHSGIFSSCAGMNHLQASASIVKKTATNLGQNTDHISRIQSGSTQKNPQSGSPDNFPNRI
jgi:hypothetical protein